ncbi:MAG: hypothetical protein V4534_05680 [Myxococcota bacterium]
MDEITAEYKIEKVQDEAATLPTPDAPATSKHHLNEWIPIIVGVITIIGMAAISYLLWTRGARVL